MADAGQRPRFGDGRRLTALAPAQQAGLTQKTQEAANPAASCYFSSFCHCPSVAGHRHQPQDGAAMRWQGQLADGSLRFSILHRLRCHGTRR